MVLDKSASSWLMLSIPRKRFTWAFCASRTAGSMPASPPAHLSTMLRIKSIPSRRKEIRGLVIGSFPSLSRSKRFSIRWVYSEMWLNPTIAEPLFNVWTARKSSSRSDPASGADSRRRRLSSEVLIRSSVSAKKISKVSSSSFIKPTVISLLPTRVVRAEMA